MTLDLFEWSRVISFVILSREYRLSLLLFSAVYKKSQKQFLPIAFLFIQ